MISWKKHYLYLADYQFWANERLFASLDHLTEEARRDEQDVPQHGIQQMLTTLLIFHRVWWAHLRGQEPSAARSPVPHEWRDLRISLLRESRQFQHWLESQPDVFFEIKLPLTGPDGKMHETWSRDMLGHLFEHAAFSRGQIAWAAMREGAPPPRLDFLEYRREMADCLDELAQHGAPHQADGG